MPWLGRPTSYASGYIRAHRTSAASQSLTTEFSSPPTYWTGFRTRGSSGSSRLYTESADIPLGYWARNSAEPGRAPVHGHQHADRDHVGEHGAAAVGDEGQRQAGDRHDAQRHPDVHERLHGEPDRDPSGHQRAERLLGAGRDPQRAQDDQREQGDDDRGPGETELLPGDREDEVGVLLGDEVAGRQRAVEQAVAEQPARADRDLGLGGAVPGALRVRGRVEERGQPAQLVGLEQVQLERGYRGQRARRGQRGEPAQPDP